MHTSVIEAFVISEAQEVSKQYKLHRINRIRRKKHV